jgi:hypothetical protein
MSRKPDFLFFFYKVFGICGLIGLTVCLVVALFTGLWRDPVSYLLGFLSMGFIIWLWHFTLGYTLKQERTTWLWETFLVFIRYILLGGLFYAMISWFVVSWPWYLAGVTTILPALVIATLSYDDPASN